MEGEKNMSKTEICLKTSPKELLKESLLKQRKSHSRRKAKDIRVAFPIPKGNTPYVRAKRAEYIERNLPKAEFFYKQAIRQNDRAESSVKDLAGIMHQQGRTGDACNLLEQHQHLFSSDQEKFDNLLGNLKRQLIPMGNCLNKALKVSGILPTDTPTSVSNLFQNSSRILSVTLDKETVRGRPEPFAILKFTSHSAARKTLESFDSWDKFKVEWVSITGEVVGDASHPKQKPVSQLAFAYSLFLQDPKSCQYALPVDSQSMPESPYKASETDEWFVGSSLLSYILSLPA